MAKMEGGGDNQLDGEDELGALVDSKSKHLCIDPYVYGKKCHTYLNRYLNIFH